MKWLALLLFVPGVAWGQDGTLPDSMCEITVTATSTPPPGFSLPHVDTHDHVAEVMKPPAIVEGAQFTICDTSAKDWSGVYNFSARSSVFSSALVQKMCHK